MMGLLVTHMGHVIFIDEFKNEIFRNNIMDDKKMKELKLDKLSGLIETRLEELISEIKDKYKFLILNRFGEICIHDENGCFRDSDDIRVKESIAIIKKTTLIGKIDYVNVVLKDRCDMSKEEFYKKYNEKESEKEKEGFSNFHAKRLSSFLRS